VVPRRSDDKLALVSREIIRTFASFRELGEYIAAGADSEPHDEPYLDAEFNPVTPEQLLADIRELERKTGEKMIFQRDEKPRPAA
jgi:hypothetical protein